MGKLLLASITICTAVTAALVYGWGQGLFYPCGPLDRYLHLSDCAIVAHWDQTIVEAVASDGDEALAAVLRSAEEPARAPQMLVSVALDGSVSPLSTLTTAPDRSWSSFRFSRDGKTLLAAFHQDIVRLFDRSTGRQLAAFEETYGASRIGFSPEGKVLVASDSGSFDRPVSQEAFRFEADGTADGRVEGAAAFALDSSGIASALTPDGTLMVQHEKTSKDTGIVALRVIEPQFASWAGSLMIAPITGWMDQILPHIWISPDNHYVAASFDSSDEWGKHNSALAVWELESRRLLTLVPTWRARWENVTWLSGGRLAASRYDIDRHGSDIAIVRYATGGDSNP